MQDRKRAVEILKWLVKHRPDLFPEGATVREAHDHEDKTEATDAVIESPANDPITVGFRQQRDTQCRHLRIRYENEGQPTEFGKIKAGNFNWYLYAWHDGTNILSFKLVDIDKMWEKGWFSPERFKTSWRLRRWDQFSSYAYVFMHWLADDDCIILEHSFVADGGASVFRKA